MLLVTGASSLVIAQLSERPTDPTGFSLRVPRVQIIHSTTDELPGSSMYLQKRDPWLAYQLGRSYFEREWNVADGVFGLLTQRPFAGAATSCAMCHNLPFRSAGFGGNIAEPPGFGVTAPHLFGIGLLETIALQIRQEILAHYDSNHNGFLDSPDEIKGRRAIVFATPNHKVDYGSLDDLNGDGFPGLNRVIKVTFVDASGKPVPPEPNGAPPDLRDPRVRGYDISVAFLSSTTSDHQLASLRTFIAGVMQTVMGLVITDHTISNDSGAGRDERASDVWAETSNAGAPQPFFPIQNTSCERRCLPVSEGELDLIEWFLLNHPAPATGVQTAATVHGRKLMDRFGCTECHVADWKIRAKSGLPGFAGDRRFFDLEVTAAADSGRLQGELRVSSSGRLPNDNRTSWNPGSEFVVKNVFTDLRHHDMGDRFYIYAYSENHLIANKLFRTPPLWGVGSTAPYGHDGRSATLDDVIRRHGGDAAAPCRAYMSATKIEREDLIAFLESLVLYQPDQLPTDLNGDGKIEQSFMRAGREVGPERFWPELLFNVAPRYRGWVRDDHGQTYFSWELLNAAEAYGRNLEALLDGDGDHVPDVLTRRASNADLVRHP